MSFTFHWSLVGKQGFQGIVGSDRFEVDECGLDIGQCAAIYMIIKQHYEILVIIGGKTIDCSLVVTKIPLSGGINPVIFNTFERIYPFSHKNPCVNSCILTIYWNKHTKCDGTLHMCCFLQ